MAAARIMLVSSSYGSIRWKPPLLHHRYSFRLSLPVVQPLSPAGSVKFDRRKSNIGGLTCLLSNPNSSWKKLLQSFARTILKKTAISAALLLMGLLVVYNSNQALAASGGRMGRRSFSSSSSSSSSDTRSYSTRPCSSSSYTRSYSTRPCSSSSYPDDHSTRHTFSTSDPADVFCVLTVFLWIAYLVVEQRQPSRLYSYRSEGSVLTNAQKTSILKLQESRQMTPCSVESISLDSKKTSILKLQVGLLGTGRSLQRDLKQLIHPPQRVCIMY